MKMITQLEYFSGKVNYAIVSESQANDRELRDFKFRNYNR
jgi:hypothetical protein